METNFSITDFPSKTESLALRTVYLVHADSSYDVRKRESENKDYIALRTYEGLGKVCIEGFEEITVLPGTILFFEHRLVRRYFCPGNSWKFYWFEFFMSEIFFPLNTLMQIDIQDNEIFYCNSCLELLRKDNTYSNSTASATINLLIHKWIMNYNIKSNTNTHQKAIEKVIECMKNKFPEILSLSQMSNIAGLSERRFRDVFKRITGYQPKKYYDMLRIKTAAYLLKNSNYSVDEISNKLGFSNRFHFSKAFKKIHGLSPAKYR
jgi:AraC-like DNA-binding protein